MATYVAIWQYLYNLASLTCLHTSFFVQKGHLLSDFNLCVMNVIHTCNSNELMQQKQGGYVYYTIETVPSYIKLYF